jgi:hypothetical protein
MTEHQNIDISALLVSGDMVALFDGTRAIAAPADEDTVDYGPEYPRALRIGATVVALMPDGQLIVHGHDADGEAVECLAALRSLLTVALTPDTLMVV